jgi:mannan endo-1,4-beta-mannosidase
MQRTRRAPHPLFSPRPILAVVSALALAASSPATALAAEFPGARTQSQTRSARQLLDHDSVWFRGESTGGAHNALDSSRSVDDQVRATTCLPRDAFVRVASDGTTFELNGEPFVFAGWNQWEVLEAVSEAPPPFRHLPLPGREHVVRQMNEAVEAGLKVMRMWAHTITEGHEMQKSPGVFDERILEGLDFVLSEASKRGLKLVLAVADNWYPVGGIDTYVKWSPTASRHSDFFTDETALKYFINTHKYLSDRINSITGMKYKDDPTILAWNLANEARCQNCDSEVMNAWIEKTCRAFKRNAPNHLVGIGTEGFYGPESRFHRTENPGLGGSTWASKEGQDFLRNAAIDCVDYAGVHVWPDDWNAEQVGGVQFQRRFIKQRIDAIRDLLPGKKPKPFVLEEFGKTVTQDQVEENALNRMGGRKTPKRVMYFRGAFDESEKAAEEGSLSGTLFWHWYDRGIGPGKYGVRSNDDVFADIKEHAREMNRISGVPSRCSAR